MLQYLVILLDETSVSFCHYDVPLRRGQRLIDIDDLNKGIQFAMKENLMIQFIYPKDPLPKNYIKVINSIDHIDIKPFVETNETKKIETDVIVFNEIPINLLEKEYPTTIFRLTPQEFFSFPDYLAKQVCQSIKRINIIIRGIDPILTWDYDRYENKLKELSDIIVKEYIQGSSTQWNILTDRLILSEMNNCEAGDSTITLAPNGKFYICPAFYYDDMDDSIGNVNDGVNIPNQHLYKMKYAPICRHCDAYQCKRCVWLNRKMTLEVNTPSRNQCIVSHFERNASRQFLYDIRQYDNFFPNIEIEKINYLDPFENKEQWKQEN